MLRSIATLFLHIMKISVNMPFFKILFTNAHAYDIIYAINSIIYINIKEQYEHRFRRP